VVGAAAGASISGCEGMIGFVVVVVVMVIWGREVSDDRGSRGLVKNVVVVATGKGTGSEELVAMIGRETDIAEVDDVAVASLDVRTRGPAPLSE
jgi:hypothetical protein